MTPPLCNFDQSKALKALGYSWECLEYYVESGNRTPYAPMYSRPTIQDAIRWFRVEKGIHGYIIPEDSEHGPDIYLVYAGPIKDIDFVGDCDTYDDAENALLNRLIKIAGKG